MIGPDDHREIANATGQSLTVIGMIIYLSLYVQNTLGYSPVQAGLRFLPLTLASPRSPNPL